MAGNEFYIGRNHVVGVSYHGEGKPLHYVRLARKGAAVTLITHGTVAHAADLKRQLGTRIPLALVISNEQVLSRVVPVTDEIGSAVSSAFPGAKHEDLIMSARSYGRTMGLSITRSAAMENELDAFRTIGFRITELQCGPWSLLALADLTARDEKAWSCGGHRFHFDSGDLKQIEQTEAVADSIAIGTDELPESHALAWAAAWECLAPDGARLPSNLQLTAHDNREEGMRVRYETGLIVAGLVLILLLAGNLAMRYKLEKSESATLALGVNMNELREELSRLESSIQLHERMIGNADGSPRSMAAFLALALDSVPAGILLDRFQLAPLASAIRASEPISTAAGLTKVQGICHDTRALNAWITRLRSLPSVTDVRLIKFNSEAGAFEIEIHA